MKIGLYFGTFNPIHIGHLIIANHMAEFTNLEEVWLVVTPHNPHKQKSTLLDDYHRLEMVYLATKDYLKLKPSDVEFKLPQPNFTVNTLAHLSEKYPKHEFALIMGEDNFMSLSKWKNHEYILKNHEVYVYPRLQNSVSQQPILETEKIKVVNAPVIEISATFIRESIKSNKNIRPLVPTNVWEYLDRNNFYK
jgi:nicotinate-nucleotide adenylyltransferase